MKVVPNGCTNIIADFQMILLLRRLPLLGLIALIISMLPT